VGNESLTVKRHGASIAQWGATQFINKGDLSQSLLNGLAVENSLTSNSTTKSLSAFQGKILKDLVDTKQDKIVAGDHISIAVDGKTVSSLPWVWEDVTPSFNKSDVALTKLPTILTTPSKSFRLVDMRNLDEGYWMIQPNLDPTVYANWINLDRAVSATKTARFTVAPDPSPALVINHYNPKVLINSGIGTGVGTTFNSDGATNEKMAFSLLEGKYNIKFKLQVTSTKLNDLVLSMFVTNGVTTEAVGVPTVNLLKDRSQIVTSVTASSEGSYMVESYIEVGSTPGTQDGITFGLSTASDLTGTSIDATFSGYLEITKIGA